jgi:hypothetical protein
MHDEDVMDRLLKDAMRADVPRLSPDFDARVMQAVRPRALTPMGRLVIAAYALVATATAAWLMRDLPAGSIAAAIAITVPVAAAAGAYARRLAPGD